MLSIVCPKCGKKKSRQSIQCKDCYKNWILNPKNHIFYGKKRPEFSKKMKGKNNSNYKGGKQKWMCDCCGKLFYQYASQIKNLKKPYCSKKCVDQARRISVNEEKVYTLYYNQKKSHNDIANELNTTLHTIRRTFEKNDWKSRSMSERISKKRLNLPINKIVKLYKTNTLYTISKIFNCSIPTVAYILKSIGIKIRSAGESISLLQSTKGNKNPNWKGGLSKQPWPFEFDNDLKEKIRERDNHICQGCGKSESNNTHKRKLSVHHIDYNKKNCNESNLISLCIKCHGETNQTRDYWYAYYTYVMDNKLFY